MEPRYESFFTYNITRSFPFRWFTPLVLIGGVILAALFTFLNFASSAYILSIETTADPNATVSRYVNSMQLWPSYLTSKVKPMCQPTSLPVNSQFFTNQTALVYTLTSVWQETPTNVPQNASHSVYSPSLAYLNNVLQSCHINSIQIDMESQDRAANQLALTEWGARVRTSTTCQMSTASGVVFLNMTQSYDYVPDTVTFAQIKTLLGSGIVSRDKKKRASMWWGESLMSTYWAQLTWRMQRETRDKRRDEWPIRKCSLYFVPDPGVRIDSIHFFQYFRSQFVQMTEPGEYLFPIVVSGQKTIEQIIQQKKYPDIWEPAANLAKSAYATVLVELGQTSATPTMLMDEALLRSFTADIADLQSKRANAFPGPATKSYGETTGTGPLSVTPSVISAQYLCQVPHMRLCAPTTLAPPIRPSTAEPDPRIGVCNHCCETGGVFDVYAGFQRRSRCYKCASVYLCHMDLASVRAECDLEGAQWSEHVYDWLFTSSNDQGGVENAEDEGLLVGPPCAGPLCHLLCSQLM